MATISPLGFYVLVHYGSQYFYGLKEKENVPNQSGVRLDVCCCALALEIYFKYVISNCILSEAYHLEASKFCLYVWNYAGVFYLTNQKHGIFFAQI